MTTSRDFITVDMRGLKAALEARAAASNTSVSELVRIAVCEKYVLSPIGARGRVAPIGEQCKISIRLSRDDLARIDARVGPLAPSRAAVIFGMLEGVSEMRQHSDSARSVSGLIASNAGLATLARYIAQLCALLEQGDGVGARSYRQHLEGLAEQVRSHLMLSASLLDELRPRRGPRLDAKGHQP